MPAPTDGNGELKEALDKLDVKLDAFILSATDRFVDVRDFDKLELRLKELESRRVEDHHWANNEHASIIKNFNDNSLDIRNQINNVSIRLQNQTIGFLVQVIVTSLGIGASIVVPILLHK